jgi:hypothetical protein
MGGKPPHLLVPSTQCTVYSVLYSNANAPAPNRRTNSCQLVCIPSKKGDNASRRRTLRWTIDKRHGGTAGCRAPRDGGCCSAEAETGRRTSLEREAGLRTLGVGSRHGEGSTWLSGLCISTATVAGRGRRLSRQMHNAPALRTKCG